MTFLGFLFFKKTNARLFYVIFILFFSCETKQKQENTSIKLKDDLGREIILNKKPVKTMALAPSMTEMLFFILADSQIVAVTQNDNFPVGVKTKKVINNYPAVDFESVLQVKPDIIFSTEGITPLDDAKRLQEMGIPVYYQKYSTVDDILKGIRDAGKIMGVEGKANRLADSLSTLKNNIKNEVKSPARPKVLAITWLDPIYVFGKNTIFTDKLEIAGAQNSMDSVFNSPYPAVTREYILKMNPDVIIGNGFETMDSTFFKLYPELKRINAYKNKRIYKVTDDLNSRPSPRVIESIIELKNLIHPEIKN